jgi:hypothetical protein
VARVTTQGSADLVPVEQRIATFANDGTLWAERPIYFQVVFALDQQMLEWTAADSGASFKGLVHHTDAEREWAYDRRSHVGRLDKALDEATRRGWTVVDMKRDWKVIFPFEKGGVGSRALQ